MKMSGYGKLYTLIICSDQLLASKFHNNFKLRKKITEKMAVLLSFSFLHMKNLPLLIHSYVAGYGRLYCT